MCDDNIKKKIKDCPKHHKIDEDQIAVNLKENPGLYTVFGQKRVFQVC